MARRSPWDSVSQRGPLDRQRRGTWQLQWTEGGRRRSKTVHGRTRRECERMLAEMRASLDEDAPRVPTCAEVWDRLCEPELGGLHASTRVKYRRVWASDVSPRWGRVPVSEVSRPEVQRWLDGMPGGEAHHARAVLARVLRAALPRGWVEGVATDGVRLPATGSTMTRDVLAPDEVARLDAACEGSPVEAVFLLCAHAGLRPGEARGLRPSDVMWGVVGGSRELCVSVTRTAADGRAVAVEQGGETGATKTAAGTRTAIVCGMRDRVWALAQEAAARGDAWLVDDGLGRPVSSARARRWWAALCRKAGVPCVPLRNLRATFVTLAHDAGVPLDAVKEQVGHSSVAVTEQVYNRPDQSQRAGQFARAWREIAAKSQQGESAGPSPAETARRR